MVASKNLLRCAAVPMVFFIVIIGSIIPLNQVKASDDSQPPTPDSEADEACLVCHAETDLSMTLPSGEILSLYISPDSLQQSIHAKIGIKCQGCHAGIETYPHPEIEYESLRELSRAFYLSCQVCHEDNYGKTLDSMHAQAAEAGNLDAPICTDCHGVHVILPPHEPRTHISEICGQCHTEIFAEYKDSIHGDVLLVEDNPDVPVCTDCHGVHNIQDPRTALFRVETPELCAGCHADPELMAKYGLSAGVYRLYSLSWHGIDVSVYKANWPSIWHESAVCTDCHGVHNIRKTDDPQSKVNPANLLMTCQECHPKAGPNWTGAWTGHYEVSLERTPFIYYTKIFYDVFTPVVLATSAFYVFLQILRIVVARVRRSLR